MILFKYLGIIFAGLGVAAAIYAGGEIFRRWYMAYEDEYVQRTEEDLYGMFSNMSPQKILKLSVACFFVVFILTFVAIGQFGSLFAGLLTITISAALGLLASLIPRMILRRAVKARLHQFDLQLLEALLSMSNALKAGFSIIQSFEAIVEEGKNPIAQEFDLMLREIRVGVKFESACENLGRRIPSEDLSIVLAGIETARQTGGNLTEVFDRLAAVIRERMRIQGRIESLTAQGRLQGWVVGLMPVALGVAFYFLQPGMMIGFVSSPTGILALLGMFTLEVVGFLIIRKIVTIDV